VQRWTQQENSGGGEGVIIIEARRGKTRSEKKKNKVVNTNLIKGGHNAFEENVFYKKFHLRPD